MPRKVVHFIKREVYLSCGCFTWVQDGAGIIGEGRGIRRKRLLAPAQANFIAKWKENSPLLVLWAFVMDYKEDLGEEVLKKM